MPTIVLMIVLLAAGHIETNAEILDVAFFVDASSTICGAQPCPNWGYIIQFICDIVDGLTIGPDNSRVALVILSDQAMVKWDFNEYSDKASLLGAIQNLAFPGGELKQVITWDFVNINVFSLAHGDRPDVRTVTIGITDGALKLDPSLSYGAVNAAHLAGVKSFMVCIATGCTESMAQQFSSSPKKIDENYFLVPDFSSLHLVSPKLLMQVLAS